MTAPQIPGKRLARDDWDLTNAAFTALGAVGFALLAIGLVDLGLAWLPPRFGSPEWEFGTISATLNNLPVPSMGLALLLAHAVAVERRSQLAAVGIWSILVLLFLIVGAIFYALDVPLALRAVQDPVMSHALKAGIVKGVAALAIYGLFHLWSAIFAFRRFSAAA